MSRLPVAPPPLPDEALSSWIARVAARYDLSADALVRHLLPNAPSSNGLARAIDDEPVPQLEAALATAAGQLGMDFAAHRFPGLAAHPEAAWSRGQPCWCPVCLFEDVAARGEVHARQSWGMGGYLLCVIHGCFLVSECPRCFETISYGPVRGRLRLWCGQCGNTVDSAPEPSRIPLWPFELSRQSQHCRSVSLSAEAGPLLRRVQGTLFAVFTGKRVRPPWSRQMKAGEVTDTLRKLCFLMLGPLWEDTARSSDAWDTDAGGWTLPDAWTPGCLPPLVAAPALLAAVTFLAGECGTRLAGVTWEPRTLLLGESARIDGETLPWHLAAEDAALARGLFSAASEPFALLLGALSGAGRNLAVQRETNRRRHGLGGKARRLRLTERGGAYDARAADRFAYRRLVPDALAPIRPQVSRERALITALVFSAIGADPGDADAVHRFGLTDSRMESRYVRYWVLRHADHGAAHLAAALADAISLARKQKRGLVLPEWPPLCAPVRPRQRPARTRGQSPRAARLPPSAA